MRECSRNRPRIDRTRMFSDSPGTPALIAQMPRTTTSIGTPACEAVLDLALDALDQAGADRPGRDQQPVELRLGRVAGELVEQPGEVLPDVGVAGEQPVVLVQPRGLRVVVAGADVAVAAQPVG